MSAGLRVAVASSGADQFRLLREILTGAGHVPVTYLVSRSLHPAGTPSQYALNAISGFIAGLPAGMDLLLPGGPRAVGEMLAGYRPDMLLVFGFNWRLPPDALAVPRLGALNVHPSALPFYRGPSPVHHGIRNGDPVMGLTVHRMTERIDSGPVLAQAADIPIPDRATRAAVWELQAAALPGLLTRALDRAASGEPGTPQDESAVTHAGFPPQEWYEVTWRDGRRDTHNQIRFLRFLHDEDPVVTLDGRQVQVSGTSLADDGGIRVECADGPLWVTLVAPCD